MSSARLTYTVEKLREQIAAKYERAVAEAEADYQRELDLPGRRAAWRTRQEKAVRALARNLKDTTDQQLADFRIKSMPGPRYHYGSPESTKRTEIEKAASRRDWALRRLEGLHTTDGTVSLTAKMMNDWFGL